MVLKGHLEENQVQIRWPLIDQITRNGLPDQPFHYMQCQYMKGFLLLSPCGHFDLASIFLFTFKNDWMSVKKNLSRQLRHYMRHELVHEDKYYLIGMILNPIR
jgi:hypothetical protein